MRKSLLVLVALAACWSVPAGAQVSANLPVTCSPTVPGQCVRAMPVTNPDGSTIGGGGGGGTPTGTAGSPNAAVVSVQGITGGTVLPIGGNVASGATDSGNPVKIGGKYSTTPGAVADGQRVDQWMSTNGASVIAGVSATGSDGVGTTVLRSFPSTTGLGGSPLMVAGWVFNGTSWDRQRGDTVGSYVVGKGSAALATNQISVATTSTQVVAARAGRAKVTFSVGAANTCAFGNTGVTTTTGFPLQPVAGATLTLETSAAVFAACSATTTVSFIEQF